MSEIVTTRPDIVIAALESQGARCGDSIAPEHLAGCPPESFCWLAGEEICVLGPTHDLCAVSARALSPPTGAVVESPAPRIQPAASNGSAELSAVVIIACVLAGVALAARRRDHHYFPEPH